MSSGESEQSPDVSVTEDTKAASTIKDRGIGWRGFAAFSLLPAVVMALAVLAGFLKWQDQSRRAADVAASESVAVARDTTTAILSYQPDTVDKELNAVRDRLTGSFLQAYTKLVNEVVIPGAKEKKVSASAKVPAAASVSATSSHAVVLVFVDQVTTIGDGSPTSSASSIRVSMDLVGGRWLVSGFDPV